MYLNILKATSNNYLGGVFKYLLFSPRSKWEDEPILTHIFAKGLVQPPSSSLPTISGEGQGQLSDGELRPGSAHHRCGSLGKKPPYTSPPNREINYVPKKIGTCEG